eukprot:2656927-Rhodomonas_salina.1
MSAATAAFLPSSTPAFAPTPSRPASGLTVRKAHFWSQRTITVPSYASATRCPVLTYCMVPRTGAG